jgi:hypothetical protein
MTKFRGPVYGKPLTVRVVASRARGSGGINPIIVHWLVRSNNDTVALSRVYIDVITSQRRNAVPIYFNKLPRRYQSWRQ